MDPIANMFSQLKNAINVSHEEAVIPYSKVKMSILAILKQQGYIEDYQEVKKENQKYPAGIKVTLKYLGKSAALNNIKRVSRPGRRVYAGVNEMMKYRKGISEILISTSSGIMSGTEARKKRLGGEIICEVS